MLLLPEQIRELALNDMWHDDDDNDAAAFNTSKLSECKGNDVTDGSNSLQPGTDYTRYDCQVKLPDRLAC